MAAGLLRRALMDGVVKLAFDHEKQDTLKHEYEVYQFLRSKDFVKGITKDWVSLMILRVMVLALSSCSMQAFHLEPYQNRTLSSEFVDENIHI